MSKVKKYFIPEFLNRIDEIIIFNSLTKEDLHSIMEIQLSDLRNNLMKKNNSLRITKSAKEDLIRNCSHREWGARPIRRIIQSDIENTISYKYLNNDLHDDSIIEVSAKDGKLIFNEISTKITKKIKKNTKSKV